MGMYTEFFLDCYMKEDTKEYQLIKAIIDQSEPETIKHSLLPHPYLENYRWDCIASKMDSFSSDNEQRSCYDDLHLTLHACFKNYDDLIDQFLDWIKSNIDTDKPIECWSAYEERELPALKYVITNERVTWGNMTENGMDRLGIPFYRSQLDKLWRWY